MSLTRLAFFATPHHGGNSTLVSLGKVAAKVATAVGFQKGNDVLEMLKDDGSILLGICAPISPRGFLDYFRR
jgi:hypothetical protein